MLYHIDPTSPSLTIAVSHCHSSSSSSSSSTCASSSSLTSCSPHSNIYSHNPAAYEVPKDNTIAKLATEYEFAADAACDAAGGKLEECVAPITKEADDALADAEQAFDDAFEKAATGACKSEYEVYVKACPDDDQGESTPPAEYEFAADDAACDAAENKFYDCANLDAVEDALADAQQAANDALEKAATGACKSEYEVYVKACPDDDQGEDDQGENDQGNSTPQM